MKNFNLWFILSLIAIFAMTCASQWNITHHNTALPNTFYTAPTEHDTIKLADIVSYTDRDGVMHFDTNKTKHLHGFTGDSIMFYYGYLFDMGEHNELRVNMKYSNNWYYGKETKYLYDLYHKGYLLAPRITSSYILDRKLYKSGNSVIRYSNVDVDTTVRISPKAAFDVAMEESRKILADLGQDKFIWEYEYYERYMPSNNDKIIRNNIKIQKTDDGKYKLVYHFNILISLSPHTSYEYFIDVKTGELIEKRSTVNHLNCSDYGINFCDDNTVPQGNVNVNCEFYNAQNIYTYACNVPSLNTTIYKLGQRDDKIYVSTFDPINHPTGKICWSDPLDENIIANAAYFGLQKTIDFFKSNDLNISFGGGMDTLLTLNLLNYGGGINSGSSGVYTMTNGSTIEAQINLGIGNTNGEIPNVKIKQIAHEFTHNVIETRGDYLTDNNGVEEYAIMEFFCDVFGLRVENETNGSPFTGNANKWKMQLPVVTEFRDFSNPLNSNPVQPKVYNGTNWSPTDGHTNSGVPAHWYYLLAEGNTQINGVGINTAFEIAKKTLFYEIADDDEYPQKNFAALRKATLKIAEKYGCNVWESARQAWDAVGVTGSTCEIAVKITTNCPSPSTCSANIITCGGSSTGTRIKILGGGLAAPINISATQHNATNLICGNTYTVEVTDESNPDECVIIKMFTCQDNAMGSIIPLSPPCPIMTASYNVINNCNDKNDLTPLLPEGTYTYNWSNGSTSQNLTNVPSGTYSLTFTDVSNGCSYQESFNITGFSEPTIIGPVTNLCNAGDQNGAINLMLFNTTAPPYTYQWSTGATTSSLNNLGQGTYNLTITDGNNCTHERSFYVAVKTPAILGGSVLPSCPLRTDGRIISNVYSGTPPYTFQWSNGKTTQNISNLSVGSYSLTITDTKGCTASNTFNVTPETSYTYADDPISCERIYTCHGQTYSEDMLDYDDIDYDFNDCIMTIPCSIEKGKSLSSGGNIIGWYLTNTKEKCRFTCQLGNVTGEGKPDNPDPVVIPSTIPCETSANIAGFYNDYYCNGVWVKSKCIRASDPKNSNNLNDILVQPNPFDKNVSIQFQTDFSGPASVHLYNIIGQEVFIQPIQIGQGINRFDFDFIDEIPNGVYLLTVNLSNGNRYTQKLIHQN